MPGHEHTDADFARQLIELALGDAGLKAFGHLPLLRAVSRSFDQSHLPHQRPQIRALAEGALWRALAEWLRERRFPVGSARETLAAAKMEGVDLAQEAMELLLPRQFLR